MGLPLRFERSYNSLTTGENLSYTVVYSDVLGYGWTHNYNVRLLLNPPGELTTTVMLVAPRGSQMRFTDKGNGTYAPFPGVLADLSRIGASSPYTYTVETNSHYRYTFSDDGRLYSLSDPIKAVPGRKTDVNDAEWIAELLQYGLLRASFVPPKGQRELRELTRARTTFVSERATLVNRVQKVLESANIKLGNVARDVMGVSGRAMLEALIADRATPKQMADLAKGRLREKREQLQRTRSGELGRQVDVALGHF